jgi:RNA recognition motif-containing protein
MSTELYVSNLAVEVTETDLESLFAKVGTCTSARLILDRETGCSRGFAFVQMEKSVDARKARAQLAGHDLRGQALRVDVIFKEQRSS